MKPLKATLLASVALAMTVGPRAFAQTTQSGDSSDVIIVTGVGPDRTADELIANTTVLDGADILERLDGGLGDTLAGLPGISSTSFGPGASRPIIRGLGAERVQVLTNGIGVIDASAASPDHAVTGDPLGAERIEVLRGPAALAYGGGATGGVVNVIDGLIVERPPERRFSGRAYGGYSSVDEGVTAAARGVASQGGFTGVLVATHRESEDLRIPGFAESSALQEQEEAAGEAHSDTPEESLDNSFVDEQSAALGVSYSGDRGFLGLSVRAAESTYGLVGGHSEEGGEEEGEPFIDLTHVRGDLRGGLDVDMGPFNRLAGAVSVVDYEHTEFEAPGVPGTVFGNNGYEARVELDNRSDAGWSGAVGAQGSRRDFSALGDEAFVSPTVTEQAGLFVFQTYENDVWGVEGGLRYDHVSLDNDLLGERTFDVVNASAGVHGHLTDALFLGFSVSRTERAPTDVELFSDGPHLATRQFEVGDPSLETERGIEVEATARWQAGPLVLSGSLYHFDFDGFIYLSPTGAIEDDLPVFESVQQDATFTGAELEAKVDLGTAMQVAWKLDAAADIVEAELSGGEDLPRIPPASATLGLEGEAGRFQGRLQVRWADDQTRVADLELPTEGWTTIDFRLTTEITSGVDLVVEGTNLTDEEVRLHASPLKDLAPQAGRGLRVGLLASF